jgi:lipopolysaccharide transport system ATP-binding protein
MGDIAIRVQGLSKQYRIGKQERYRTLRDVLMDAMYAPFRRAAGLLRGNAAAAANLNEIIWALRDVSFEIKKGDVVGIVGRNGAGKSTLLKILSRITDPTKGQIDVYGHVGALLEVGTGFHSELTGRENIYLNGAILGMSRAEIRRKFDEIVAFAEVERFIDTPVKHYSSGMALRLGFAVSVHLEPEILIIDEILAVGDAQFQKKCLEKMYEVGRGGRTILFVSHNMSAVRNICNLGMVLRNGEVVYSGDVNNAVDKYVADLMPSSSNFSAMSTSSFDVNSISITSGSDSILKTFAPADFKVTFTPKVDLTDPGLYIGILTFDGLRLTGLDFKDFQTLSPVSVGQQVTLGFVIPEFPLLPGHYQLEVHLKDMAHHIIEPLPQLIPFEVVETPVYGGRSLDAWFGQIGLKPKIIAEIRSHTLS